MVGLEFGADDHVTKPFDLRERLARIRIMSRRTTEQGHGARLCALRDRRSGATTMGSTALDGLMLGRRSGAVDRGVLPCPMQQKHMAASTVEDMLCDRSGLLGVSGISDDLRLLEASGDSRAGQAMDLFACRAAPGSRRWRRPSKGWTYWSSAPASANGRHGGGIAMTRDRAGPRCERAPRPRISAPESRVDVFVIPADQEIVVARATGRLADPSGGRIRMPDDVDQIGRGVGWP